MLILPVSLVALLVSYDPVAALRLEVEGRRSIDVSSAHARRQLGRRGNVDGATPLDNTADISYYANITLGGKSFKSLIDTGSSDLWVAGTPNDAKDTGKTSGVNYAVGAVQGPVKLAKLEFSGYTINDQAYLEVTPSDEDPEGEGLIGFGPSAGSNIHDALTTDQGLPVLDRIFLQNTSTPNYLTVSLGRKEDPTDIFSGNITVGEIIDEYKDVSNQPKLNVSVVPVRQQGDQHFQILVDADGILGPDGQAIQVDTQVDETKNDKQLTAVVDTGFSLSQVPRIIADSVYSRIEGSEYVNVSGVGATWIVPCKAEVNMTWKFSGQSYPIHPLDTTLNPGLFGVQGVVNSNNEECCIGSFQPMSFDNGNDPTYDIILGMSFLRNVYALFDYGDFVGEGESKNRDDPYIQLLSTTESSEAHSDFVTIRLDGDDTTSQQTLLPNVTSSGSYTRPAKTSSSGTDTKRKIWLILSIVAAALGGIILLTSIFMCIRRRRHSKGVYAPIGGAGTGAYPMNSGYAAYGGGQGGGQVPAYKQYAWESDDLYDPHSQQQQQQQHGVPQGLQGENASYYNDSRPQQPNSTSYNNPWDHRT